MASDDENVLVLACESYEERDNEESELMDSEDENILVLACEKYEATAKKQCSREEMQNNFFFSKDKAKKFKN